MVALLVAGCRGREPVQGPVADAVLTARTLGLAYLRNDQLPQAESAFRKVIELAPEQGLGYANLALVHMRQGRYQDAESDVRRAVRLDSATDDVLLMQAQIYRLTGRDREAREDVARVLQRSPNDLRALYAMADLAAQSADSLERGRTALYLRRVVDRSPANLAARLELIDLLLEQRAADSAVAQLEALQRQLPALPREATRFFDQTLSLARSGRAADAAVQAGMFHRFMETTAAYQASLQHLHSAEGALAGYPILTVNPDLTTPPLDASRIAAAIRFSDVTAGAGLDGVPAGDSSVALALGDYDNNGSIDLFVNGRLYSNALGRATDVTDRAGIHLRDRPIAAAFGDYDNDGRLDLFVATAGGATLWHNENDTTFKDVTAAAGLGAAAAATTPLFLDLDHDGDLDLFVGTAKGNRAFVNPLDGPFQEAAGPMGLVAGSGGAIRSAAFGDFNGDGHTDLITLGADGRIVLYQNLGQGHFGDATLASGIVVRGHVDAIAVGDYDNDGFLDLFVIAGNGVGAVLYHNRGDGTFAVDTRASATLRGLRVTARDALFFDFDNDGWLDLAIAGDAMMPGGRGVALFRNDGSGRFADFSAHLPADLSGARRLAAVDWDHDGDLDLLAVGPDGRPRLWLNDGGNANQYVQVQLTALRTGSGKNNEFGIGSTLELRAGDLFQSRVVTGQVTHFGLGRHLKADVLRARWPNGVAQTVYYPGTEEDILEQQVLKGSCPFLYAWTGTGFTFLTDVMWRSALGMPLGIMAGGSRITSAPPQASQEYVRLPAAIAPRDGRYVLQLTDELWETAYIDQVRLIAVDHPDSIAVYVDEHFVPPGAPPTLRLYQVSHPRPPIAATDDRGADVLPQIRARDEVYVAPLAPGRYQGVAAPHDLILDFGDLRGMDSVFLFLTGWIYPSDASINLALAQAGTTHVTPPYLQVKDRAGQWRTVADVGFPSGKNKTVIVDLTGRFLSADHRVRIRTNMEVYWDAAFINVSRVPSPVVLTTLAPASADLHYRGVSRLIRKGGRYGPTWPLYDVVSRDSPWEAIPGAVTRYGDVRPLLDSSDDQYLIMAPGDEATLSFDVAQAPPLRPGWTRDFLLYSDAWVKDADRNTAQGGTVGPLPFHSMKRYPYRADEAYPTDPGHRRFLDRYTTRRVGPLR